MEAEIEHQHPQREGVVGGRLKEEEFPQEEEEGHQLLEQELPLAGEFHPFLLKMLPENTNLSLLNTKCLINMK